MIARIQPSPLAGSVRAISSKSMAHRLIIAAALADRPTAVRCGTTCADIDATARCLNALGASVRPAPHGFDVDPIDRSRPVEPRAPLDCSESGSTFRFMLPVACALGCRCTFTGADRLAERPIAPLVDELVCGGADIGATGAFPLEVAGPLRPGRFELPGDVSSQYVSGLMLAAPLLGRASEVLVRGRVESRPYIELTSRALGSFGIEVSAARADLPDGGTGTLFSVSGEGYRSPGEVSVEGDWSNAAFWLAAGAMGADGVEVDGLDLASAQGDRAVLAALTLFGARIVRSPGAARALPERLHGAEIDVRDIPDLVPILAAVASVASGETRFRGCGRLRIKESDRLATTTEVLSGLGADARIEGDDLVIRGRDALAGGKVDAHNDHRIAMMAAVAASRAQGAVEIHGAEAVAKSYPSFFDDYRALGGAVELIEG